MKKITPLVAVFAGIWLLAGMLAALVPTGLSYLLLAIATGAATLMFRELGVIA